MATYFNWSDQSENFDNAYSEKSQVPFFKNYVKNDLLLRQKLVFDILGDIKGKKILDLGCGVGRYSHLASLSGAKVIGIDISKNAIEIAKTKAKELGVENSCEFICEDFIESQNNFNVDCVIALGFVQYFNNPIEVISDILKNNQKIIFDIPTFFHWINPCRKIYRTLMKGIKFKSFTKYEMQKMVKFLNEKHNIELKVNYLNPTIFIISNN
jgi:cyclopropane fatty-acyl-phospholipid synthase-like methyltransferase